MIINKHAIWVQQLTPTCVKPMLAVRFIMEKFKELVSLCKASVEISVNDHKDYYESVEQHINKEEREDIEKDVFDEMVKRDTVVKVQAYPHTPIGFFVVYHYDIDMAVNIALDAVKNDR